MLPFVLKFPQSLSSHGVFVVRTEADGEACPPVLDVEVPLMLRSLNVANAHLDTASLILQDMLPGGAVAHSTFVTKAGWPVFIGCCEQVIGDGGLLTGAIIDYQHRVELEALFAPTAAKMAAYVFSKGRGVAVFIISHWCKC